MGAKYIIEIEETYAPVKRRGAASEVPRLYRAKGFNSLVFDGHGLNKLEKYDPDKMAIAEFRRGYEAGVEASKKEQQEYDDGYSDGYDAGLNDAWEVAKKISFPDVEGGIAEEDMESIFGFAYWIHIMEKFTAAEAIAKIEAYEEKKKAEAEIRVGDEVELISDGTKGVVYEVVPGQVNGFCVAGRMVHFCWRTDDVKKTGKHFPQIEKLLWKMKEGEE